MIFDILPSSNFYFCHFSHKFHFYKKTRINVSVLFALILEKRSLNFVPVVNSNYNLSFGGNLGGFYGRSRERDGGGRESYFPI